MLWYKVYGKIFKENSYRFFACYTCNNFFTRKEINSYATSSVGVTRKKSHWEPFHSQNISKNCITEKYCAKNVHPDDFKLLFHIIYKLRGIKYYAYVWVMLNSNGGDKAVHYRVFGYLTFCIKKLAIVIILRTQLKNWSFLRCIEWKS